MRSIAGQGTGLYQGSYYTYTFPDGTPDYSSEWTAPDYKGRKRTDRGDGKTYLYYESPASVRNDGNIYLQREDNPKIPISSASGQRLQHHQGRYLELGHGAVHGHGQGHHPDQLQEHGPQAGPGAGEGLLRRRDPRSRHALRAAR